MRNTENNKVAVNKEPIDINKISPAFKAYLEAKEALFAKYEKVLPMKEAA